MAVSVRSAESGRELTWTGRVLLLDAAVTAGR